MQTTQHRYTCRNCGKVGFSTYPRDFCGVRCNKTYLQRKYRDQRTYCPHNAYVVCDDKTKCATCGWNPDVEKARKEHLTHG